MDMEVILKNWLHPWHNLDSEKMTPCINCCIAQGNNVQLVHASIPLSDSSGAMENKVFALITAAFLLDFDISPCVFENSTSSLESYSCAM